MINMLCKFYEKCESRLILLVPKKGQRESIYISLLYGDLLIRTTMHYSSLELRVICF